MKHFRKTLPYKVCGYFSLIFIAIVFVCTLVAISKVTMWQDLVLVYISLAIFVIMPYILLPVFLILSVIGLLTKNKYINKQPSVIADIGYIIMCALAFISIFSLQIQIHDIIRSFSH